MGAGVGSDGSSYWIGGGADGDASNSERWCVEAGLEDSEPCSRARLRGYFIGLKVQHHGA